MIMIEVMILLYVEHPRNFSWVPVHGSAVQLVWMGQLFVYCMNRDHTASQKSGSNKLDKFSFPQFFL